MSKKSSAVINLEYYALKVFFWIIRTLPEKASFFTSQLIGCILWLLLPKRRRIVRSNLRIAFPDKPYTFRKKIAAAFWSRFSRLIIDLIRTAGKSPEEYASMFEYENVHFFNQVQKENKGWIVVAAHFSNWELNGTGLALKNYLHATIGRPLDNPRINTLINEMRESKGLRIIPHRKALKESLKLLKEKKSIGIIIDQNFHHGGVFITFFGQPASATNLPAILALKTGAPILPVRGWWKNKKFHIEFDTPFFIDPNDTTLSSEDLTQKLSDTIERWIREKPECWLWAHDRWKRQPTNDKSETLNSKS